MSHYIVGHQAEKRAAQYLRQQGYRILQLNWRTRSCEIDIVAVYEGVIYFVEVKYRRSSRWGTAVEYITPKKLKQMQFAANSWVHRYSWKGDYRLAAVALDGTQTSFVLIDS